VRSFHVYILASRSRVLYIGVTNDLIRRIHQHTHGGPPAFTRRYHVTKLVYFEQMTDIRGAIAREKQLKRRPRSRKVRLIELQNSGWVDLATSWGSE
jgi:putative endonuclease